MMCSWPGWIPFIVPATFLFNSVTYCRRQLETLFCGSAILKGISLHLQLQDHRLISADHLLQTYLRFTCTTQCDVRQKHLWRVQWRHSHWTHCTRWWFRQLSRGSLLSVSSTGPSFLIEFTICRVTAGAARGSKAQRRDVNSGFIY